MRKGDAGKVKSPGCEIGTGARYSSRSCNVQSSESRHFQLGSGLFALVFLR
jgi:hypothetical protein